MSIELPIRPAARRREVTVMRGQAVVDRGEDVVLSTLLGSCVAACLFDPDRRIGGMNHFLLSEPASGSGAGRVDEHYGVYLMELLVNEMIKAGASRSRLRAHLYGGANLHSGMAQIGAANATFARDFVAREGIALTHADLGGTHARKIEFMPGLGRARCRSVEDGSWPQTQPMHRPEKRAGEVELF